jgi:glutathione S-transferase
MLTLFHNDTAVCAAKVRLTLAEKSLPWEGKKLDLGRGEQFDPNYLKLNPQGVVPTLIHDGNVVVESTVINEYLDEAFPQVSLRPSSAFDRARMRVWTKREDSIHDAINTITTAVIFRAELMNKSPEERAKRYESIPEPSRRAKWRKVLEEGLESDVACDAFVRLARLCRDMEGALASSQWLMGDALTLADVGLISFFYRLELLEATMLWSERFPRVPDWYARCKARPTVIEAVLRPYPEARVEYYRSKAGSLKSTIELRCREALASL